MRKRKSELDRLTRGDILEIRRKFHTRMYVLLAALANRYDIHPDLIWRIVIQPNTELDNLTRENIEVIQRKFHDRKNVVIVELAEEYGVTHNLIWQIVIRPFVKQYRPVRKPVQNKRNNF